MDPLQFREHRPYPLPERPWRMRQRWKDLLFAHWPVPAPVVERHLPAGLEVDIHEGWAWLGVVPFRMENVCIRVLGQAAVGIPTARAFPELNLRTYVRSRRSGIPGVWFFSLDAGSALAVAGARVAFSLPYFPARMEALRRADGWIQYASRRVLPRHRPGETRLQFRPTGEVSLSTPGSLAAFLTERYRLYTVSRWTHSIAVGEIHHRQWPLQPAEAEWTANGLPADFGFSVGRSMPLLHFSRELEVVVWGLTGE